jgi:hypothetical protein
MITDRERFDARIYELNLSDSGCREELWKLWQSRNVEVMKLESQIHERDSRIKSLEYKIEELE